jgi:pimeloyl-ACP methyl ester carboxylesterase
MISGFVDIGGLDWYYERHGRGAPLVLLHGAMGTIESCFSGLLSVLAEHFEVIAIELQGHGHTRDVDRPLTYEGMAQDTVALLDVLGIDRARFAGYSMGGAVALQLAFEHPERVDHLVFAGGVCFETNGMYPELRAMFDSFDPHQVDGTSWHEAYRRVAPDPDAWTSLVLKLDELDRAGDHARRGCGTRRVALLDDRFLLNALNLVEGGVLINARHGASRSTLLRGEADNSALACWWFVAPRDGSGR